MVAMENKQNEPYPIYCNDCSRIRGLLPIENLDTLNPTGTAYQCMKHTKHTAPTGIYSVNSVFDYPDRYVDYLINAGLSGSVQLYHDGSIRKVILFAREYIGSKQQNGFVMPTETIILVYPNERPKTHIYSEEARLYDTICSDCGCLIHNSVDE